MGKRQVIEEAVTKTGQADPDHGGDEDRALGQKCPSDGVSPD